MWQFPTLFLLLQLYSMFAYGIIIHTPFVLQVNIAQGLVHMGKGL
jgi:hypothetical protein